MTVVDGQEVTEVITIHLEDEEFIYASLLLILLSVRLLNLAIIMS